MPPLPSIATMRYRPASSAPGANRPSREVRAVLGEVIATVCVRNASLLTALPQREQNRPLSGTSPPQDPHFAMDLIITLVCDRPPGLSLCPLCCSARCAALPVVLLCPL